MKIKTENYFDKVKPRRFLADESLLNNNFHCSGTCLPLKNRARFTDITKNLGQAFLEFLFTLLNCIVLYRETENEIYRIKEGK